MSNWVIENFNCLSKIILNLPKEWDQIERDFYFGGLVGNKVNISKLNIIFYFSIQLNKITVIKIIFISSQFSILSLFFQTFSGFT